MKNILIFSILIILNSTGLIAADFEKDSFKTSKGELAITFIGHGTLMMEFNGKVIHIDPVPMFADYKTLPKADLILVTHAHGDHLNLETINTLKKNNTEIVIAEVCKAKCSEGKVMKNGDSGTFAGLKIEAVAAYNIKHTRGEGNPFHPKGEGNGYVIQFGDKKVYVAGDTENITEMKNLENIDIAFLPMNLPYTMTPEMVFEAAISFQPEILYPYHFGDTNTNELLELMKNQSDTEVRIRKLN